MGYRSHRFHRPRDLDAQTHDGRDRRVSYQMSPLVQGDHRRVFLDLLGCRYGRRFANPWSFVEYAPAENLGLDFTVFTQQPPCAKQPPA